jgi:two-component system, NarL family, response regulator NreC
MRIIIAEDFVMFREVVARVCRSHGHTVLAEVDTCAEAVRRSKLHLPDALILDLVLADGDGFSVLNDLPTQEPPVKVLILTAYCDAYSLMHAENEHVLGFIDKQSNIVSTIAEALRSLEKGNFFFSERFKEVRLELAANLRRLHATLTEWEGVVLALIGTGLTDDEIAEQLCIAPRTVQGHRSVIMRKLSMRGTPKLMAFALQSGYVKIVNNRMIPMGVKMRADKHPLRDGGTAGQAKLDRQPAGKRSAL